MTCPNCTKNGAYVSTEFPRAAHPLPVEAITCVLCGHYEDLRLGGYEKAKLGGTDIYN